MITDSIHLQLPKNYMGAFRYFAGSVNRVNRGYFAQKTKRNNFSVIENISFQELLLANQWVNGN